PLVGAHGLGAPGRRVTTHARRNERYGDFELVRYLTAGGMADLWLARSQRFSGELVVKQIQPRYIEMTRVVQMFIDEGRIAQALDHPNVVKVGDVGHEKGTYFIAMEYIPGRDLLAICRRGVEVGNFLPRHLAVAILAQAARGLVYAHEKAGDDGEPLRVVHCDLSPGNIVVGWGGTVKLVDFGIARATIMLRESDHSVAGKYNYMAPEQIRGEAVDARADLFALGIILYELTVGKRLFRGRPEQVMRLVLDEPIPRPTELRPDFPASLEHIIMRALERDPARRYQTARALRTDLMAWLAESGLSHDKRRIAEYLRGIFNLKKQRDADEFSSPEDDEELVLEQALPRPEAELQVDAEDPPDEVHLVAPPAAGEVRPIMEQSTAPIDTDAATGPKHRISLAEVRRLEEPRPAPGDDTEPLPLGEPPTVRLRADDTKKRILLPAKAKPRSWWKRLVRLFRRR
ncbi:MAG: serine/threonine-protein kinase, partial [Polyangia bacterium]